MRVDHGPQMTFGLQNPARGADESGGDPDCTEAPRCNGGFAHEQVYVGIGQSGHCVVTKDRGAVDQSVGRRGGQRRGRGPRRLGGGEDPQLRAGPGESRGDDAGAAAEVNSRPGSRVHFVEELQKEPCLDVDPGPCKGRVMSADSQGHVEMLRSLRVCRHHRTVSQLRPGGNQDSGLLLCQGRADVSETVVEHVVHGVIHGLERATEEHRDLRVGVDGGKLGDFTQCFQDSWGANR